MSPPSKAVYVPPRPNLGPEPMPAPRSPALTIVIAVLCLALGGMGLVMMLSSLRRRARRHRLRAERAARHGLPRILPESPRARWIVLSKAIRKALAARFGPGWRARTTEEIAALPDLAEVLGPARAAELIDLLRQGDRAKFAETPLPDPPAPLPYLSELVMALAHQAGARSRIKGK